MNFVDEEHVPLFEISELRGQIARLGNYRPRGRTEIDAELARDDLRERCLAEPRRPDEQDMIERVLARLRRLDEDFQVLARGLLAGEVGERLRPERRVGIVGALFRGYEVAGDGGKGGSGPMGGSIGCAIITPGAET
jgi:hypothetical protein